MKAADSFKPSIWERAVAFVKGAPKAQLVPVQSILSPYAGTSPDRERAILAHYESGQTMSDKRSWLPEYVQDARQDIEPGERLEMVRKARYFEKNNGYLQKTLDMIEVNVVGRGIKPTPVSSNPEWNKKALAAWERWCKFADLTSRQSFYTLQAIMARAQAVDGEIFVWLTYGEPDELGRRYPRIKLIETHRVCDANIPRQYNQEGFDQYDGILFDQRGRPMYYIVTNGFDAFNRSKPGQFALVPANEMVHVFEPSRAGQPRGITLFHAVLHDLHDLDDLQSYEMDASKNAASVTNVVKTATGELEDDGTLIGKPETVTKADGTTEERIVYYQHAFGRKSRTVVLKHGDEWSQADALRPTAAQQQHWEIILRKYCAGVGHSYPALTDYTGNIGGASLRAALASDNRFYDVRGDVLATAFDRIWEHVIRAEIADPSSELANPPADWRDVVWQRPRRATVDVGRESKAMLEELRAGVRTYRDIHGENGDDWKKQIDQVLEEKKYIQDRAKELGIPAGLILSLLGASNNTNIFADKAAAAIDGEKPDETDTDTDTDTERDDE